MTRKNTLFPLLLMLGALALLIPGVTQPMLTISGSMDKSQLKDSGIDIIVDSLVGEPDDNTADQSSARQRIRQMIGGMTRMIGLGEISGEIEVYRKTRSILGTVSDLFHSGDTLVAFLVMLFSILIPLIKILLSLLIALLNHPVWRQRLLSGNSLLSKWSMADVFVVALIVTYMAANASSGGGLLTLHSNFEPGFYYFLGYCLFSIASMQLYQRYGVHPQQLNALETAPTATP